MCWDPRLERSKGRGCASQVTQEEDPVTEGWGWGVLAHCPMVGASVEANHAGGTTLFQRRPPRLVEQKAERSFFCALACWQAASHPLHCTLRTNIRRFASYLPAAQTSSRSPPVITVDDRCAPPNHPSTVPNPYSTGLVPSCVGTPSSRCG